MLDLVQYVVTAIRVGAGYKGRQRSRVNTACGQEVEEGLSPPADEVLIV